ncbi:uncharacterized protein CEXT_656531 [Caerostris extrusa]|uniref:Uncharacterized protein n=1 Tax=Caerostris extrusa TaxID=172846 RepID=A0AAV4X5W3_CAEEX|nr:uncharacterized protein CEXT_656531 [Caerostris extrusa]
MLAMDIQHYNHPCACTMKDGICVGEHKIMVVRDKHAVAGYPAYALPSGFTDSQVLTLFAWLTRHKFYTFGSTIENGSLVRYLTPSRLFRSSPHPTCPQCECHSLVGDPVYCLKNIVLSAQNKGPTIESVT